MVIRSYTEEGFPLPTIEEWNAFVAGSSRSATFRGAVDDLQSSACGYCGEDMIRQRFAETASFIVGVVYCNQSVYNHEHPLEYWVEVWPYGGKGSRMDDAMNLSDKEMRAAYYRLSNPLIKKCYSGNDIDWHQNIGLGGQGDDFGLTYSPGRTKSLPKPMYVHEDKTI